MMQHWYVCAIVFWRVVWYRAGTFLCMRSWPRRGRGRRALDVVAVASVASWTWPRHGRDRVVFVPQCGGCDTPINASVCNGLCGVCVVLVCYLTG